MRRILLCVLCCLLVLLCFAACAPKVPERTYEELAEFPTVFSDVLYACDLAITAYKPAEGELIEREDGLQFKRYTLKPDEVIYSREKVSEEITIEEPVTENGTRIDAMKEDTQYLVLTNKAGKTYCVYSDFCVTEVSEWGQLVDNLEPPAPASYPTYIPWSTIERIRYTLREEVVGVENLITFENLRAIRQEMDKYSVENGGGYWPDLNYQIVSVEYEMKLFERGEERVYKFFNDVCHGITDENVQELNKQCILISCNANNHSMGTMECHLVYDLKAGILYG